MTAATLTAGPESALCADRPGASPAGLLTALDTAIDSAAAEVGTDPSRDGVDRLTDAILAPMDDAQRSAALRYLVTRKLHELVSLTSDCDAETFLLSYNHASTDSAVAAMTGPLLTAMYEQDRQAMVLRELLIGEILAMAEYEREQWNKAVTAVLNTAREVNCGHCWARPAADCADTDSGVHVARLNRANRRGLVSGADLVMALQSIGAPFTAATVVPWPWGS